MERSFRERIMLWHRRQERPGDKDAANTWSADLMEATTPSSPSLNAPRSQVASSHGKTRNQCERETSTEPENTGLLQSKEMQFLWNDINPISNNIPSTKGPANALPSYNDVSGATIVDWNGQSRHLSPEEEQERQITLQQAVRERMLGLPKTTDITWARPWSGTGLPPYSASARRNDSNKD
ncbi:hypothetical protein ASPZODRAFT_164515 [Penicilliopsis zonata CBS 506.65]|uniref:Uncharacterized protein n=1 Tax=Penicilliopsis zonata CBS 506.65 TaxID=1073090 RepID=A0A1L9SNU1_9EURO|nr:hypothetical protein ASPZODRAFT_164515 [Penicilliopsis zonata CBS 506.65]OJJ48922.1 hypothetical protein ASPZODRAFT_164515 [Penicilliopsis zonata CBS 506.65]